jgi:hypothetical protein
VAQHDAGHDSKTRAPEAAPFTFTPSNFVASSVGTTGAGDVEINTNGDSPNCTADSDKQTLIGPGCSPDGGMAAYAVSTVALPMAGGNATVFVMNSLTIDSGASLSVTGSKPVIFYVLGAVSLSGTIDGTNDNSPGASTKGIGVGVTPDDTGGGAASNEGGSGGSFCGLGGLGGFEPSDSGAALPTVDGGYASGSAYGEATLIPLVGGSAGGGEYSGLGAGALQITSNASISIGPSGGIQMNGLGGSENNSNVGGGGSGGAILLEAPTVTVAGTLTANGGGGGDVVAGDDSPGDNGYFTSTPSSPAAGAGSAGGAGGAGTVVNGANGSFLPSSSDVGAGGGGVGWIRINTESGMARVTGVVSPSLMSKCATQGTLE